MTGVNRLRWSLYTVHVHMLINQATPSLIAVSTVCANVSGFLAETITERHECRLQQPELERFRDLTGFEAGKDVLIFTNIARL